MVEYLKKEWNETKVLFRCVPTIPFAFLVACLIAMNFLANRGGAIGPVPFDCGIIVSWVVFLASDMLVKRFGAKAAIKINIAALLLELVSIGLMTLGAMLPFASYGATPEESAIFIVPSHKHIRGTKLIIISIPLVPDVIKLLVRLLSPFIILIITPSNINTPHI